MNPIQHEPSALASWTRLSSFPDRQDDSVRRMIDVCKDELVHYIRGRGFRSYPEHWLDIQRGTGFLNGPDLTFIRCLHDDGDKMETILNMAQREGRGALVGLLYFLKAAELPDWADKMGRKALELCEVDGGAPGASRVAAAELTRSEAEVARLQTELAESRQQLHSARQLLEERARVIARQQDDIAHLQTEILLAATQGLAQ